MRLGLILILFLILSALLVLITIEQNVEVIYNKELKKQAKNRVQLVSTKPYVRTKKDYIPNQSCALAEHKIKKILAKKPIYFELNNSALLVESTLIRIAKIVNHVREDIALTILAHTDATGTAQHNLTLSQKRADSLKEYFLKKTNLPLVVAIGYGEAFSLKNRLIEIDLKRIK